MIKKSELKGKYVTYICNEGKWHTEKVIKISGKTLTVRNANKEKSRIHPDKQKIFGRQFPKKGLEEIDWRRA